MFNANLAIIDDEPSCYVMHKHMVIDFDIFEKEFDMDPSLQKLTTASIPDYHKDLAINLLFSYQTPKDVSGKLMIIALSLKDRILYLVICKLLFPCATNFT